MLLTSCIPGELQCVRVCVCVGNLTKHMKSKAHMKKCLELGVSMSSVEDNEADEGGRKHTHTPALPV